MRQEGCGDAYASVSRADLQTIYSDIMNYSFLDFLGLLGAVGLFLYGMKVMSEGLQKAAGDRTASRVH